MKLIIRTGIAMLILAIVLIALSVGFMRAHAGVVANENRPVDAQVVNIVMSGSIDLVLQQASMPSMVIKGDASMLSRVTSKIEGNTLFIGTRGLIITTRQPLIVELNLPNLEKLQMLGSGDGMLKGFRGANLNLETRGSGDLRFEGEYQQIKAIAAGSGDIKLVVLNNEKLELSLQGSGDGYVKGQTKILHAKLSGSGDLDAASLKAAEVTVDSTGSANSRVIAIKEIKVSASGSGDVSIFGNPLKRNVERSGSAEIHWQ
jgi:hypothetical protein